MYEGEERGVIHRLMDRYSQPSQQLSGGVRGMGTTVVELDHSELECVGGDYGEIHLRGTSAEARDAIEQIVGGTRRGSHSARYCIVVTLDDREAPVIQGRNAGREGTPESGVGAGTAEPAADIGGAGEESATAAADGVG